jgi:4-hydroxy-2-oxoheptanedioate aldolase
MARRFHPLRDLWIEHSMRPSTIQTKLSQGKPVLITTLHFAEAAVFEMTSLMGFDGIWMDLEHHTLSVETASQLMRAARVGRSDILARPGNGEFARMSRLLEAGAQGIMYPRCRDAEEARVVVDWVRFPPLGKRGIDSGNPDVPYLSHALDDYVRLANERTFLMIQVEDPQAVSQAEAIAAVEGVDAIMLGPADFSAAAGITGQFDHPEVRRAGEHVAQAARRAGKHWASIAPNHDAARRALAEGSQIILHNADLLILKAGLERIQQDFRSLGFEFENELERNLRGCVQA